MEKPIRRYRLFYFLQHRNDAYKTKKWFVRLYISFKPELNMMIEILPRCTSQKISNYSYFILTSLAIRTYYYIIPIYSLCIIVDTHRNTGLMHICCSYIRICVIVSDVSYYIKVKCACI